MERLMEIFELLLEEYGPRNWWPAQTAFEMMVGAILTQNTAWTNVEKAISNFGSQLSPQLVDRLSLEELAQLIRPCGYFNQKALHLKHLTYWFQGYRYDIERVMSVDSRLLRDELLRVKGVGPETADSILLYALDKPFFVVDAYTRWILSRLGYEIPGNYDSLRGQIEAVIAKDTYVYGEFHALIVEHAKQRCKKSPDCGGCPLEDRCKKQISQALQPITPVTEGMVP